MTTTSEPATNQNSSPTTVCRFRLSELWIGYDPHVLEFQIDLDKNKHSLLDIVVQAFEMFHEKKLTYKCYDEHLWSLTWEGIKYNGGWRDCPTHWAGEGPRHIDHEEPRFLVDLELAKGQRGTFLHRVGSFTLTLEDVFSVPASTLDSLPKAIEVANQMSAKLEADWLTMEEKQRGVRLADQWYHYYEGNQVWRGNYFDGWQFSQPTFPEWSRTEYMIIALLINAGGKFKKSWNTIMQYTFLDRRESACSGCWYKVKGRESWRLEGIGENLSNSEKIIFAKVLAKDRMRALFAIGEPRAELHPEVKAEKMLRKRGLIDDTMDQATKKQKLEYFVRCNGYRLAARSNLVDAVPERLEEYWDLPEREDWDW
jgi:hypothetical protein